MENISQHGLALDSGLVSLKRMWVLSELVARIGDEVLR